LVHGLAQGERGVVDLAAFLLWQGQAHSLGLHWKRVLPLGVVNSGIPFICYAYAVMSITTG